MRRQRDQVSPELWHRVIARDAQQMYLETVREMGPLGLRPITFEVWSRARTMPICVAAWLDPSGSGPCSGRQTVDHVKDEPGMGRRAPSDEQHLVAMCYYHNVIKPPSKVLRQKERQYLRRLYL